MSRLQYSRLCGLIHDSLHPFTVKSTVSITKEQEKSILITLSQVLNKIKLWTAECDMDSDSSSSNSDNGDHAGIPNYHPSPSHCIHKITNQLVLLLAVESEFIQHLTANVLISISEFVVASEYWEEFMQSLCCYFELILCKLISPSSDRPVRAKHMANSTEFTSNLQRVLDNARWHSAAAIVSILRAIFKQLKHEDDVKSLEVYFQVVGSCLEVIPWDTCNMILFDDINARFRGYLVQLFCSLADSEDENRAVREIFNIFPKTLTWFFGEQEESYNNNNNNTCVSRYIRHKILVLMIRLSYLIKLDCKTAVSWLRIIEKYFRDLLSESVTEPESDQDDCLKDSPFNRTSYRHLQRRVIFLYLRCAFSLIGLKDKCGNMNSCSKSGFTALYEWVKKHLPKNILDNHELYDECCKSFTKSFIRLYMHEDDMLFKILLQLAYAPFQDTQIITEDQMPEVVSKDILFLLSDIFDPVFLFHLFLSELHYDHQVLIDYLISKDTGASCAEYLLRCLRIICDKWDSFSKFPFWVQVERQPFHKRRKFESEKACERALFNNARDCLLLLKKSLESLHRKDLFPYNPQVLLRRLTRFQELCLNRV